MSMDKPPSLPIPTPPANSNSSSPRTGASSLLNGAATNPGAQGGPQLSKVKTDINQSANQTASMQQTHVLPHPNMSSHPQTQYSSPHTSTPTSQYGYPNEYSSQGYGVGVGLDFQGQQHLSQPQNSSPQTATSGNNFGHLQHHPAHNMQSYSAPSSSHQPYPFHFPSPNGVQSPSAPQGMANHLPAHMSILPLPGNSSLSSAPSPLTSLPTAASQTSPQSAGPGGSFGTTHTFDTTGQVAPPGMKPRVTATLWEDEGSLCFQVEAKGVCVARREDNHMINGTKLLNVAGMTRGRRDGILKSEKIRHVVKIGPMHLKGVWIPFDRALDFANKEKITELLYPLFVHNIGSLLYHPTNTTRTNAVMAAANRKYEGVQGGQPQSLQRRAPSELLPSSPHPALHHGMSPLSHIPSHSIGGHGQMRPELARAITFPTPPSSASSINLNGSDNPYWNQSGMMSNSGSQGLAIDTVINSSRSLPTTPATTPPGNALAQLQYGAGFNEPRSSQLYGSQNQGTISQQNMARFGPPLPTNNSYNMNQARDNNNMGPPSNSRGNNSRPSSSQNNGEAQGKDGEGEEQTENEYDANLSQYNNASGRYFQPGETPHLSPDISGSPNPHGPGTPNRSLYNTPNVNVPRGMETASSTPRNSTSSQHQQWMPQNGYSTPPRGVPNNSAARNAPNASRNLYNNIMGENQDRSAEGANGNTNDSSYNQHGMQGNNFGGALNNPNKRGRDMEEQEVHNSRPSSRDEEGTDEMGLKRRKTITRDGPPQIPATANVNASNFEKGGANNRPRSVIAPARRAR